MFTCEAGPPTPGPHALVPPDTLPSGVPPTPAAMLLACAGKLAVMSRDRPKSVSLAIPESSRGSCT